MAFYLDLVGWDLLYYVYCNVKGFLRYKLAGVAELAYAHDSNSCTRKGMRVQFPPSALGLYQHFS
jgi:hypothetical protein